jgi:hypothetical protein
VNLDYLFSHWHGWLVWKNLRHFYDFTVTMKEKDNLGMVNDVIEQMFKIYDCRFIHSFSFSAVIEPLKIWFQNGIYIILHA